MKELTAEMAAKWVQYNPLTGDFIWLSRDRNQFATQAAFTGWNSSKAGNVAGSIERHGYRVIGINDWVYKAHRLAWLLTHGEFPADEIDHINGDRADNRLCNLRAVSHGDNLRNARRPVHNKSGHVGVIWHRSGKKWMAYITARGVRTHLGLYSNISDAIAARKSAQQRLGFHENHGRAA
jgi:hypothetical protein